MDPDATVAAPHPVLVALAAVDAGVQDLAAANLWSMAEQELLRARIEVEGTRSRLDATVLAMTREIDGRGAAVRAGASSTAPGCAALVCSGPRSPTVRSGWRPSWTATCPHWRRPSGPVR